MGGMGGYSASGGDATSGNGDVGFSAGGNEFGGLNYKGGVSPLMILGGLLLAFLVVKNV